MQITIKGKNLHVGESLKSYAEKKLEKIGKQFNAILEAVVELTVEKNPSIKNDQHCEITLFTKGPTIRAVFNSSEMFASIDGAIDKLERQISSYKGKAFSHKAITPEVAPSGGYPTSSEVVKAKRFELKPTSVDEAAMQIDLLQHDFYVFRNVETEEINIIYRRKDGNLGLIEPV